MLICHCKGVNDHAVRTAIAAGARDLDDLGARCGAGTGCGGCIPVLRELLREGIERADHDTRATAA